MSAQSKFQSVTSPTPAGGNSLWKETRTTLLLALPIIVGQLLQNGLNVIDTLMVGRVSVVAVAAASLASALFVVPLVCGFGVLGPFSVFVAAAAARGNSVEAVHTLRRGLALAFVLAVGLALIISALIPYLFYLDEPPAVAAQARAFLELLTWSILPMYLFQIQKQYCEALHTAWPPMAILVAGVLLNIALNWVFIFGHLGAPPLGIIGAGWATLITRTCMFCVLAVVVIKIHFPLASLRREFLRGRYNHEGYRELLGLGIPAGMQVIIEVGAFTCAALMMGWLSATALAAHQVAICIASTTFMIPLGLSMALAIRVSHALGSNDFLRARRSIQGALLATVVIMMVAAIVIFVFTHQLAVEFIQDPNVILVAQKLLLIAGLFQICDGIQIVCGGALRGLHDVRVPTLINACGYWVVGLPVSYLLSFHLLCGPTGVWIGLLTGLGIVSILLTARLRCTLRKFEASARTR